MRPPSPLPRLDGYGSEADFDGQTLTLRAKGGAGAIALFGTSKQRETTISRSRIWSVKYGEATRMINGRLDLMTDDGKRYQLHFRWGQRDQPWRELAEMLTQASQTPNNTAPTRVGRTSHGFDRRNRRGPIISSGEFG